MKGFLLTAVAGCLLIAGCGAATGSADTSGNSGSATVTIDAPADGANVGASFPLTFKSSAEIGPPESGKHHVHVSTDGNADDYTVVTSSPFQVTGLSPGRHTVSVTLQNADHSPAGATAEITVNVTGGGGGAPSEPEQDYGGGGY